MTDDKRTKAELIAELEAAQYEVREARSVAYEAQQSLPADSPENGEQP